MNTQDNLDNICCFISHKKNFITAPVFTLCKYFKHLNIFDGSSILTKGRFLFLFKCVWHGKITFMVPVFCQHHLRISTMNVFLTHICYTQILVWSLIMTIPIISVSSCSSAPTRTEEKKEYNSDD